MNKCRFTYMATPPPLWFNGWSSLRWLIVIRDTHIAASRRRGGRERKKKKEEEWEAVRGKKARK